jgi:hypothetical protein
VGILPAALDQLSAAEAVHLTKKAAEFLEFGGSVTLHFTSAGGDAMRRVAGVFDDWREVLQIIARSGNAILISFIRSSPKFFAQIGTLSAKSKRRRSPRRNPFRRRDRSANDLQIAETDAESALAAFPFEHGGQLQKVSLAQFEEWVETGLAIIAGGMRQS